jgi:ribosomal small subunit protein bTHX
MNLVKNYNIKKTGFKMIRDYFVIPSRFTIIAEQLFLKSMGRGDKKSKKGKRTMGSFGVSRNKKKIKTRLKKRASKKVATVASASAKPKKTARKKADA